MNVRHIAWAVAVAVAAVILLFATRTASAADMARGQALYASKCGGCHAESVHGRIKRQATDFDSVRAWVERWNVTLRLRWETGEVDDVAAYLNNTYYGYRCPPSVCKVVSLAR